jgi:hypothetical protein
LPVASGVCSRRGFHLLEQSTKLLRKQRVDVQSPAVDNHLNGNIFPEIFVG